MSIFAVIITVWCVLGLAGWLWFVLLDRQISLSSLILLLPCAALGPVTLVKMAIEYGSDVTLIRW